MSYIARSRMLGASLRRAALQPRAQTVAFPVQARLAHQDYGSGDGHPVGENPSKQGPNPSADKEHPGPPPPKEGHGSGSSPTKGTAEGHTKPTDQSSGSSQQKRQFSTMRRLYAEKKPKSTEGLEPKILNESPPKDESAEVAQHNKEFDSRTDRAHESVSNADAEKDKVSPKFWSEDKDDKTGGRDKSNS